MNRHVESGLRRAFAVSVVVAAVFVLAERLQARGIPSTGALTYCGVLEAADGKPLSGLHTITVDFWDAADGGGSQCTSSAEKLTLTDGRFSLPLTDACTEVVSGSPDVWTSIQVDRDDPLPRTKLGAVPYAVEARSAEVAAGASGDLEKRLKDLEQKIEALENKPAPSIAGHWEVGQSLPFPPDAAALTYLEKPALAGCSNGKTPIAGSCTSNHGAWVLWVSGLEDKNWACRAFLDHKPPTVFSGNLTASAFCPD